MNNAYCTGDCYGDLSFMGVAYDPKCDPGFCDFLYECDDDCCFEDECCC